MTTAPDKPRIDDPNSVRKTDRPGARGGMEGVDGEDGTWWPLAVIRRRANGVDAIIEPHVGGRWHERGDDGSTRQWGSVLSWEPLSRLVLSWDTRPTGNTIPA